MSTFIKNFFFGGKNKDLFEIIRLIFFSTHFSVFNGFPRLKPNLKINYKYKYLK